MPLFYVKKQKAKRIAPRDERIREDVIHRLIEGNLSVFFEDLTLVARKPRIGGKEFDTLALNSATKAPVILEYKREKSRTVVEQVDLYFVKLKNNKADVMLLLSKCDAIEDWGEVDFDNPEIIAIAKEFTPEQREIAGMKRKYLRLFRYQLYQDSILNLEEIEPLGLPTSSRSASGVSFSAESYTVDHFGMKTDTRTLYERLDKGIVSLDSRVKPAKINKYFIGYGATGPYFCCIRPRVHSLIVEVKYREAVPKIPKLELRRYPEQKHTPMTHYFQLRSPSQLDPSLKAVRLALRSSM